MLEMAKKKNQKMTNINSYQQKPTVRNAQIKETQLSKNGVIIVVSIMAAFMVMIIVVTVIFASSSPRKVSNAIIENSIESISESSVDASVEEIEYDSLQKAFLELNFNTSESDVENLITKYNFEYSKEENKASIKYRLAYTHLVAINSRGVSGDHIEISFDTTNGMMFIAEYFNSSKFKTASLYSYGTFLNFPSKNPNNDYSGYYYYKPGDSNKNGIVIEYPNGYSQQTYYHRCDNAEEALNAVMM